MSEICSILVIKLKHIGDVLLASPVFQALRDHYPAARICALVPSGTQEMLTNNPCVDEVLLFDRDIKRFWFSSLLKAEWKLLRSLRARKFDVAIDLSGGDRGAFLSFASGAPRRLGYRRRKGVWGRDHLFTHVVDQDFSKSVVASQGDLLRLLGITEALPRPCLHTADAARAQSLKLLESHGVGPGEPYAVFHPTSRWMFKSWEASQCARLADLIAQQWECRVVFTCGPEEKELKKIRQIMGLLREPAVDIAGKTTLSVLAAVIARARAFIGVDSAPMHMAYALGVPTLALFGPSDPVQWAPYSQENRIITKRWACQPCRRDGCLGSKVSQCLTDLSAEEVAAVMAGWMPGVLA